MISNYSNINFICLSDQESQKWSSIKIAIYKFMLTLKNRIWSKDL